MGIDAYKLITELLRDLNGRQIEIAQKRFGLFQEKRHTLAALGKKYHITRERVRQIESTTLQAVQKSLQSHKEGVYLLRIIQDYLAEYGNARKNTDIIADLLSTKKVRNGDVAAVTFLLAASGMFSFRPEDDAFHTFWHTNQQSIKTITSFTQKLSQEVSKERDNVLSQGTFTGIFKRVASAYKLSNPVAKNYLTLSKKFEENPYGDIGLASWPEIKPKTVRDRAYLVLKKDTSPLHFKEISNRINVVHFGDTKQAHPSTVHNELIKDKRFVLVGRGTYSLAEHGYTPGTAKDVIARLLTQHGPLPATHVVKLVQQERLFRENTILLNLQNKQLFRKTANGAYDVNGK